MKIKLLIFLLSPALLFFFFSCDGVRNKNIESAHKISSFPDERHMEQFKIKALDIGIFKEPEILVYDTILFILDRHHVNGFLRAYDIGTFKEVASFGMLGRGPDEFISPGCIQIDSFRNDLWFLDITTLSFNCISIDSLLKGTLKRVKSKFTVEHAILPVFNYHLFDNGNFLVSTSLDSAYYTEINQKGEVKKTWGLSSYPRSGMEHQLEYNYFYYKNLAYNEELNVALATYHFHDMIVRYDFESNTKDLFMKKGFKLTDPITSKGNVLNREKAYSLQIKHNSSFVFASYMGGDLFSGDGVADISINYPNEIHVFDWDAQPVAKLIFPDPIISFDICNNGNVFIYANSVDTPLQIYELQL